MHWILDLLTPLTELQAIIAPPLISTLYKSPQQPVCPSQPAVSYSAIPWQRFLTLDILQLLTLRSSYHSRPCRTLSNPNWQLPTAYYQFNYSAISSQSFPQTSWDPHYTALERTRQKTIFPKMSLLFLVYSLQRESVYRAIA
jgi:hypothetical protein